MFTTIIIVIAILLFCVAAMSISIWIKKDGKFPETEISRNKNMKKLGIKCAKQEEIEMLNRERNRKRQLNLDCGDCTDCELSQLAKKK